MTASGVVSVCRAPCAVVVRLVTIAFAMTYPPCQGCCGSGRQGLTLAGACAFSSGLVSHEALRLHEERVEFRLVRCRCWRWRLGGLPGRLGAVAHPREIARYRSGKCVSHEGQI